MYNFALRESSAADDTDRRCAEYFSKMKRSLYHVIREQLRTYLLENFMFGASSDGLDDHASLLETGILDSTGVLELVLHLEEKYGIAVATTELVPENLDSVDRLQAFRERKGVGVGGVGVGV